VGVRAVIDAGDKLVERRTSAKRRIKILAVRTRFARANSVEQLCFGWIDMFHVLSISLVESGIPHFTAQLAFGGIVAGEPYHGMDGEGSNQIVLRDNRFA